MEIIITDEELSNNGLKKYSENIASFASYVDKKVGYTTDLINIKYNHLMFWYELEVKRSQLMG